MHNFKTILKYSLKPKIFSKSFAIFVGIVFGLSLILINAFPVYDKYFKGEDETGTRPVYVVTQDQAIADDFIKVAESIDVENYYDFEYKSEDQSLNDDNPLSINIDKHTINSYGDLDMTDEYLINQIITSASYGQLVNAGVISSEQIGLVQSAGQYEFIDEKLNTEEDDSKLESLTPITMFFGIAFYMILVFAIGFTGSEILEEKSSRAMEIIIPNVDPAKHMFAKVLANVISVVVMILVIIASIIISGLIALQIMGIKVSEFIEGIKMAFNLDVVITLESAMVIVYFIILFFLSIFIALLIIAVLASTVSTQEDYQKISTPVIMFIIVPYMFSIMPGMFALKTVLAYIPIMSIFFAPTFIIEGSFGILQASLVLLVNIVTLVIIVRYGSMIYKEGVLNYSSRPLKEIVKSAISNHKYDKKLAKEIKSGEVQ